MIKEKIEKLIKDASKSLNWPQDIIDSVALEHPKESKNGDYSFPVIKFIQTHLGTQRRLHKKYPNAMLINMTPLGAPLEAAQKIKVELEKNLPKEIEKIEIAGAGFINFYLSPEFYKKSLENILEKGDNFGKNNNFEKKVVLVEHTDANLFKEFHIGHLMPNVIGSTIARLFEWSGAEVKQVCYQGDVGMHIARTMWGLKGVEDPGSSDTANGKRMGMAYTKGSKAFEEDEIIKKEITGINKKIYAKDQEVMVVYNKWRKASLAYFDVVYKILGTHFEFNFFESDTAPIGEKVVLEHTPGIFEKSDGAIVFKAEKIDSTLHTRVFINSEGLPTYETKELGLAKIKEEKYHPDLSIVVTGNEINDYFKVLLCAMQQIFPEIAKKTKHISHGMLRLPAGKMSSRKGDVITFWGMDGIYQRVIDEIYKKVEKKEDNIKPPTDQEIMNAGKEVAEKYGPMAIGAIKYMILRQSVGGDIIFDIEKSVSVEGDSGVYLQYAYVRAKSVVEKSESNKKISTSQEIYNIEKLLYRFEEVVERAGKEYAPHYLITYLTEVASLFNSFYANNQIINPDDVNLTSYRTAIAEATRIVLKNGLNILGIPAPEKM